MVKSIKQAIADLKSSDAKTRVSALESLRYRRSKQARSAVVSALDDPASAMRITAALAIGRARIDEGVQSLIDHMLSDPSTEVRYCCAASLRWIHAERFRPGLIRALSDSDPQVVAFVCAALSEFKHPDVVNALKGMLQNPSWDVRLSACISLVLLRQVNEEVVACLEQVHLAPEASVHNVIAKEANASWQGVDGSKDEPMMYVTDDLLDAARLILKQDNSC